MKIRIVKCSDGCWYSRLIGEVFDVYVYDDVDYMTKGNRTGLILKSDCEIVDHSEDSLEKVEKSCKHLWDYRRLMVNPPINKRTCRFCKLVEYKDDFGEYREPKYQQEDKPKKLKLRMSANTLAWIQGELCATCDYDVSTCDGDCNLQRYVKGEK